MVDSSAQAPSEPPGVHLVLYDGICGLCSRVVQFLLVHDRRRRFDFASLQSETGRATVQRSGADPDQLTTFYVVANYRTPHARVIARGRAAMFVAGELGWPWRLARVMAFLPTAVLNRLYDAVARNRYRLFGRRDQCLVPSQEFRTRF